MRAEFNSAFNSLKDYLAESVPELGGVITHWEDPFLLTKNRAIMLPDSHAENSGKITFSAVVWASTVEKSADTVAQAQMGAMEKIFKAVYSHNAPFPMTINAADYFDPPQQSPNVGIMRVLISMSVEYLDDCDF